MRAQVFAYSAQIMEIDALLELLVFTVRVALCHIQLASSRDCGLAGWRGPHFVDCLRSVTLLGEARAAPPIRGITFIDTESLPQIVGLLAELFLVDVLVEPVPGDEFVICATFGDATVFEYEDQIAVLHRRDAMGDRHDRLAIVEVLEMLLDLRLRLHIHRTRRVIHDQDRRIVGKRTGQAKRCF